MKEFAECNSDLMVVFILATAAGVLALLVMSCIWMDRLFYTPRGRSMKGLNSELLRRMRKEYSILQIERIGIGSPKNLLRHYRKGRMSWENVHQKESVGALNTYKSEIIDVDGSYDGILRTTHVDENDHSVKYRRALHLGEEILVNEYVMNGDKFFYMHALHAERLKISAFKTRQLLVHITEISEIPTEIAYVMSMGKGDGVYLSGSPYTVEIIREFVGINDNEN